VDYGAFRYFASVRVVYSFDRQYSWNNYTLFVTFGIIVNTFVCMCEKKCSWAHMRWIFGFGLKSGYDSDMRAMSTVGMLA
jgi:hypothetical protein